MDESTARTILNVEPNATYEEIKKSYRFLAKSLHPDSFPSDESSQKHANVAMGRLSEAWATIEGLVKSGKLGQAHPNSQAVWNDSRPPSPAECEFCGAFPATAVDVSTVSTFVFWVSRTSFKANLCGLCGLATARYALRKNMLSGWWGFGLYFLPYYFWKCAKSIRGLKRLGYPESRDPNVVAPYPMPMAPPKSPLRQPLPIAAVATFFILCLLSGRSDGQTQSPVNADLNATRSDSPSMDHIIAMATWTVPAGYYKWYDSNDVTVDSDIPLAYRWTPGHPSCPTAQSCFMISVVSREECKDLKVVMKETNSSGVIVGYPSGHLLDLPASQRAVVEVPSTMNTGNTSGEIYSMSCSNRLR